MRPEAARSEPKASGVEGVASEKARAMRCCVVDSFTGSEGSPPPGRAFFGLRGLREGGMMRTCP